MKKKKPITNAQLRRKNNFMLGLQLAAAAAIAGVGVKTLVDENATDKERELAILATGAGALVTTSAISMHRLMKHDIEASEELEGFVDELRGLTNSAS